MDDNDQAERSGLGRPRRWAMRAATVAVALTPFVLLEIGLRWVSPEGTDAVDYQSLVNLQETRPLFVLDREAGRWRIPEERFNFFRPDSFFAEKRPGSRRIFVLGGSTVQGRPYSTETSFSTWLMLRLQAASPETEFEVVNCGGVSYASYRVSKILAEVLHHQPDAIVIYTGHNEFLEDREYAEVRAMSGPRRWVSRVAANIRTVTWLQDKLNEETFAGHVMAGEVDARLDHVGGLGRYDRDPRWRTGVERHFADTLARMVTATKRAEIPLVMCVPAGEVIQTPPFKVESLATLSPQDTEIFRQTRAVARDADADTARRLSACATCLAIDPEHAGVNYIAGRLHYQRGEADLALPSLMAARDFDVCPLRATTPIVSAVIAIAERNEIPLIRTHEKFDQRNSVGSRIPDGIVDPEFFLDHVHPSIAGHQLIGAEIATEIERLGWFPTTAGAEQRYQQLAGDHLAQLGEEYYARGRQRLEGLRRWAAGRARQLVPTQECR